MTERRTPTGELGFEAFGTACGLAVVVGGLSVVLPAFDILTATLAALAVAGWASLHRRERPPLSGVERPAREHAVAFAVLGAAAVAFLDPPGPFGPWRALGLGLGLVPLWVAERGSRSAPRRSGREA